MPNPVRVAVVALFAGQNDGRTAMLPRTKGAAAMIAARRQHNIATDDDCDLAIVVRAVVILERKCC